MSDSVWILLAGDADKAHGRNFAPFFCRYGLAAMGPGQHGPYGAAPERYAGPVQRFVGMPKGALIALALGKTVTAVGEVTEAPYQYEMGLGHADARDLRHVRRVAWRRIDPLNLAEARRSPLSVVGGAEAQRLRTAWEGGRPASSGTEYLPDFTGIGDQGVLSNLAGRGAPFDRLDAVAAGLVRARRLAAWNQSTAVSSAEVRTLLVVPFLEALGWSPLSIRLDWRRKRRGKHDGPRLEMALLERPDRTGSAPRAAIVVSRPGAGLQQMLRHAEKTVGDGAGARLLVATDGRMWQVRIRDPQGWAPWATLDLVWPTARFHFDADASDIPGATEAIEALSPWAALPRPQKEAKAPELPPEVVAHLQGDAADAPTEGTGKKRRRRRRRKRGGEGTAAPQAAQQVEASSENSGSKNEAAPSAGAAAAPKVEAAPAPKAEAAPAPKAEPAPAPEAEAAPAPEAEAAPAPEAEAAPAPKAEAAPAPKAEAAPAPKAEAAPAPKAEPAPAPKSEAAPAPKAEAATAPKAEPAPAPKAEPPKES